MKHSKSIIAALLLAILLHFLLFSIGLKLDWHSAAEAKPPKEVVIRFTKPAKPVQAPKSIKPAQEASNNSVNSGIVKNEVPAPAAKKVVKKREKVKKQQKSPTKKPLKKIKREKQSQANSVQKQASLASASETEAAETEKSKSKVEESFRTESPEEVVEAEKEISPTKETEEKNDSQPADIEEYIKQLKAENNIRQENENEELENSAQNSLNNNSSSTDKVKAEADSRLENSLVQTGESDSTLTNNKQLSKNNPEPVQEESIKNKDKNNQSAEELPQNYLQKVAAIIAEHKTYPEFARAREYEGNVVVSFLIGKNGDLKKAKIADSSGYDSLDQQALAILKRAAPFPAFPEEIVKEQLSIKMAIVFELE
jgi:protein TonB